MVPLVRGGQAQACAAELGVLIIYSLFEISKHLFFCIITGTVGVQSGFVCSRHEFNT